MKKITICFVLFVIFALTIKVQAAGQMCTGPIYSDADASQACATLAETQGKALGYTIACISQKVGLLYPEPNTGFMYYFNATCTVNGYEGQGAQLLVGYTGYTGPVNGRSLSWNGADSGWGTFATNLKSFEAAKMCGGTNYGYNQASGQYYCLPSTPTTTKTPTTPSVPSTPTTPAGEVPTGSITAAQNAYVQNIISVVNDLIQKYKIMIANTNTGAATNINTATNNTTGASTSLVTVNADVLNIRSAPNTQVSVSSQLKAGNSFIATCYVVGENIEGSSKWWKTSSGSYIWAGGTSEQSTGASVLCQ